MHTKNLNITFYTLNIKHYVEMQLVEFEISVIPIKLTAAQLDD